MANAESGNGKILPFRQSLIEAEEPDLLVTARYCAARFPGWDVLDPTSWPARRCLIANRIVQTPSGLSAFAENLGRKSENECELLLRRIPPKKEKIPRASARGASLTLRFSHVFKETTIEIEQEGRGARNVWGLNENYCDALYLTLDLIDHPVDLIDPGVRIKKSQEPEGLLRLVLYFNDGAWWNERTRPRGAIELPFRRESLINWQESSAHGWSMEQGISFLRNLKDAISRSQPLISSKTALMPLSGSPLDPRLFPRE